MKIVESSPNGKKTLWVKEKLLVMMKIAESSLNGYKTPWEKEKLLKFSFSHIVFKWLVLQTRKNQGLFGEGLNQSILIAFTADT